MTSLRLRGRYSSTLGTEASLGRESMMASASTPLAMTCSSTSVLLRTMPSSYFFWLFPASSSRAFAAPA